MCVTTSPRPPPRNKLIPFPGEVDLFVGGPPCQGVSGNNRHALLTNILEDPRNRQLLVFLNMMRGRVGLVYSRVILGRCGRRQLWLLPPAAAAIVECWHSAPTPALESLCVLEDPSVPAAPALFSGSLIPPHPLLCPSLHCRLLHV